MNMKSLVGAAVGAVIVATSLAVIGGTASATTGEGGSFVPVTPTRVGDTSDGTGFSSPGAFTAGSTRSLQVTGRAGVPATNVGAVVLDVAGSSTADSRQYVYPSNESQGLASLSLGSNEGYHSNTIIVRPGPDGRIKIHNERGTTQLNVDIQGYFTKTSTDNS